MKKFFCKIISGVVLAMCLVYLTGCTSKSYLSSKAETNSFSDDDLVDDESVDEEPELIYVQVNGAVVSPGVYQVERGTRLFEVIEMAGGLSPEADDDSLNQAVPVADGDSFHIMSAAERQEEKERANESGLVNINTADATMLMTLPGIGQSKADMIISYRDTNGPYKSIEDIMQIQGIKEGVFNKIKDKITVSI